MAVIEQTITRISTFGDRAHVIAWLGMATTDTGKPLEMPGSSDRSVQINGTFGGATVTLRGSNDGVNYVTLTDPQGNAISATSATLEAVTEITRFVRPEVSGGAGVNVNVYLLVKRVD